MDRTIDGKILKHNGSVYVHTNVTRVVKMLILNISQGKEPRSESKNKIIMIMLLPRGLTLGEILYGLVHVKSEINLTCNSVIFCKLGNF